MESKEQAKKPVDMKTENDMANARLIASEMRKYPWDYFG